MGTDISGWVEAKFWAFDDEDEWCALINAGLIVDRDYDTFRRLFGVRMHESLPVIPLAANRGLPATMSAAVRDETGPKSGLFLAAENYFHSATWLTWAEIQSLDWETFGEGYQTVFEMMRVLAANRHYTDMRLVVWFGD